MSARYRSEDEARDEYVAKLGPDLGLLFHQLQQDVFWLHLKWAQYRALYGSSQSRIEILNDSAPLFFRILQDSLWEDTLLHISRLTDPSRSRGKSNLTIRGIEERIEQAPVRDEIVQLVNLAVEQSSFAHDWRKRRIAHTDLSVALGQSAVPLAPASRQHVELAIAAIGDVLGRISEIYFDSELSFYTQSQTGDAVGLLETLRDGNDVQRMRQERLASGSPQPEDLAPRPAV